MLPLSDGFGFRAVRAPANGGGVFFFAHVGGFICGVLAAGILTGAGRITPGRDKEMRNEKGQGYP